MIEDLNKYVIGLSDAMRLENLILSSLWSYQIYNLSDIKFMILSKALLPKTWEVQIKI